MCDVVRTVPCGVIYCNPIAEFCSDSTCIDCHSYCDVTGWDDPKCKHFCLCTWTQKNSTAHTLPMTEAFGDFGWWSVVLPLLAMSLIVTALIICYHCRRKDPQEKNMKKATLKTHPEAVPLNNMVLHLDNCHGNWADVEACNWRIGDVGSSIVGSSGSMPPAVFIHENLLLTSDVEALSPVGARAHHCPVHCQATPGHDLPCVFVNNLAPVHNSHVVRQGNTSSTISPSEGSTNSRVTKNNNVRLTTIVPSTTSAPNLVPNNTNMATPPQLTSGVQLVNNNVNDEMDARECLLGKSRKEYAIEYICAHCPSSEETIPGAWECIQCPSSTESVQSAPCCMAGSKKPTMASVSQQKNNTGSTGNRNNARNNDGSSSDIDNMNHSNSLQGDITNNSNLSLRNSLNIDSTHSSIQSVHNSLNFDNVHSNNLSVRNVDANRQSVRNSVNIDNSNQLVRNSLTVETVQTTNNQSTNNSVNVDGQQSDNQSVQNSVYSRNTNDNDQSVQNPTYT